MICQFVADIFRDLTFVVFITFYPNVVFSNFTILYGGIYTMRTYMLRSLRDLVEDHRNHHGRYFSTREEDSILTSEARRP